jgi:UDP-glucose 4-epimerase
VYGIRTAVLRLTNTYGPRMRVKDARQTFLGVWIRRLIEGQPILVYGDGTQVRDFNYVEDVIDALLLAASIDEANGEIFNLGASDPLSLQDTAKLLIEIYGKGSYELIPFPSERQIIDIGNYYGSYSKIQSQLGWQPTTSFRTGVEHTLGFYGRYSMHYWQEAHAA